MPGAAAAVGTAIGVSLKMYFDHSATLAWSRAVAEIAQRHEAVLSGAVTLFVLPSFVALPDVITAFHGTGVGIGAQDLFWEDRGAFTGEVSGTDLTEAGCQYVEVGHAERRRLFGETDQVVAKKTAAALRNGLTAVLCVGETVRISAPEAAAVCIAQLESALVPAEAAGTRGALVVAYEPEWAIGADAAASPAHVREVCSLIRGWLDERASLTRGDVIYGGSAGPGTLSALAGDVDGLFLGRFAHDPESLEAVLDEALALRRSAPSRRRTEADMLLRQHSDVR
jgi:triosephosphate isomerase